jgi:hypothetical protein
MFLLAPRRSARSAGGLLVRDCAVACVGHRDGSEEVEGAIRILLASLLQAQVVAGADAGRPRELLAAKTGHPPPLAVDDSHGLGPHQTVQVADL